MSRAGAELRRQPVESAPEPERVEVIAVGGPFDGHPIAIANWAAERAWELDWENCTAGTYRYEKSAKSRYAWYRGFTKFPSSAPRAGEKAGA